MPDLIYPDSPPIGRMGVDYNYVLSRMDLWPTYGTKGDPGQFASHWYKAEFATDGRWYIWRCSSAKATLVDTCNIIAEVLEWMEHTFEAERTRPSS